MTRPINDFTLTQDAYSIASSIAEIYDTADPYSLGRFEPEYLMSLHTLCNDLMICNVQPYVEDLQGFLTDEDWEEDFQTMVRDTLDAIEEYRADYAAWLEAK